MKNRPVLPLLILLIFYSMSFAQTAKETFKVSGAIADSATGKGLSGVSVVVFSRSDNKNLTGGTTDEKGNFSIENIKKRNVRIRFSMVGYQTKTLDSVDLDETPRVGLFKLRSTVIQMPEIVIQSVKPMVEFRVDRQVINMDRVPGNMGSVTEALRNSGSVEVNPSDNKITVRGQTVKLQMDGRPYEMPVDMLAQMPASMIEQVEVILAPGAKESAEGGAYILNLVSKKNTMDNYNGSVNISSSTSNMTYGGLNMNYKEGKLNLFSSLFGSLGKQSYIYESDRFNLDSKSLYHEVSRTENSMPQNSVNFKLGADYDLDANNSFTFYGTYGRSKYDGDTKGGNSVWNSNNMLQYTYSNNTKSGNTWSNISFYGFYKKKFETKGHEITFDAMYNSMEMPSNSDLNIGYSYKPGAPYQQKSSTGVDAKTFIFKTDYVNPIGTGKLEAGYNFTYRTRDNDYSVLDYSYFANAWQDSLKLSNLFRYSEDIHALYTTYSQKFGRFDIKAGVRAENLHTLGEQKTGGENFTGNFFNLFPNINVGYKLNDMFMLTFNAFRRVTYPQVYYINPFKQYMGPNSYRMGNPGLKPYFLNSFSLSLSQYINTYYVFSNGMFTRFTGSVDDSVSVYSFINIGNNKTYGIELTLPYFNSPMMPFHLPDFIQMMNVVWGYTYREQQGQYLQENLTYSDKRWWLRANLSMNLWYDVSMSTYFMYSPKSKNTRMTSSETKMLYLSFNKSFFDRKLKVSLSFSDLLRAMKFNSETFGSNFYSAELFTLNNSRSISLGITYMFNDYKEHRERNIDDGRDKGESGVF
ncbi:MAG: outer membrane beta-barrel protein [archaeon]